MVNESTISRNISLVNKVHFLSVANISFFKVLGKLEDSPFPPPNPPYDPDTNTDDRYLPWHAHITAVTVASQYRRIGHASRLVRYIEHFANKENAWFMDLFVRVENTVAIEFYKKLG